MTSSRTTFPRSALGGVALVSFALTASLVGRFVWLSARGVIQTESQSWQYAYYSLLALRNSLPAIILIGLPLLLIYRRKRPAASGNGIRFGLFLLSLLFAAVFALSGVLPPSISFPRETWLIAWPLAGAGFLLFAVSRELEPAARDRLLYNRPTQLLADGCLVAAALLGAYLLRFDGWISDPYARQLILIAPYVVVLYLIVNFFFGVYSLIWRYTSIREALIMGQAVAVSALLLLIARIVWLEQYPSLRVPFGILLIHPFLAFLCLVGARVLRRIQYRYRSKKSAPGISSEEPQRRVLLVGAGQAGQLLLREMDADPRFQIVGFLDDDPAKQRRKINGVAVVGTIPDLLARVRELAVDEVVLAMPSAPLPAQRRIVQACEEEGIRVSSVPSLAEIVLGKVHIARLRSVRMEDLLGRASVVYRTDDEELLQTYQGRRILVTGGGGSIGSELARQLSTLRPASLHLLDKDENSLYETALHLRDDSPVSVEELVADVKDESQMIAILRRLKPHVIFHAAAYKHVPLMEKHPREAVLNNVLGTRNLVRAALQARAEAFVLISTDKAVNPTSIMGASKRIAEMIVQDAACRGGPTRFCSVRFGNVLGSRASVVPVFQEQIEKGSKVTVTHPEVRRYFMTIPEAVQLVIQAGSLGQNGEIFILEMGDPVKIVDLARELIQLSGLVPDRDIRIEFTGLRAGEKLHEELLAASENGVRSTRYPKIFVAKGAQNRWPSLEADLQRLEQAALENNVEEICQILLSMNIGYHNPARFLNG